MEERMEDKCYKYIKRGHSGFTNEPYVSTKAHLFLRPCLHGLFNINL